MFLALPDNPCFYILLELKISLGNTDVNEIAVIYKTAQALSL